jgi:UDP-2,3-diacylglucosamine pyrophosphatase LpxH
MNRQSPVRRYRTVFLSDVHLGSPHCHADRVLGLLQGIAAPFIYLIGDIIDFDDLARHGVWPAAHRAVLGELLRHARNGTRIVYVPGNHDRLLRGRARQLLGPVAIMARAEHQLADGRRLLLLHGDEVFARLGRAHGWLRRMAPAPRVTLAGPLLARAERSTVGRLRHQATLLAARTVRSVLRFDLAALALARAAGCDGVVCGHIHIPELKRRTLLYANTGDWLDNCTALVEHLDGALELIAHRNSGAVSLARTP